MHHFTKEAMDSKNEYKGYEPQINFMRGGGRWKDTATHVFLVNAIYSYSSLINLFYDDHELISHLWLLHVAKNRNDAKAVYRMQAYPAYNRFTNI